MNVDNFLDGEQMGGEVCLWEEGGGVDNIEENHQIQKKNGDDL